ncbi:serine/threonine-protein kinase [Leptolyngbya sp. NIES-2104]|uniref:serine/threonine-protein kinase n=1 Tax=Leptolyngbya sp. NIES-2104 TaxID=1552121 RepID=UPI0006EC9453|nr:serine/threonine-protein kinase [Leptolyngbya sp. NIES-2104]GAP95238.1 serine/threonine kinase [Leptolyngbya sp. NIES-2104]
MQLHCTRPSCARPLNHLADLDDPNVLKSVPQKFCTCCGMPLILAGRYLPMKLLGKGGFGAAFLARDRYTPGFRQCVVKQFQPSGNLSSTQLKIAQDLFEREAEVLEQLGREHPQIPDLFAFFELTVPNSQNGKDEKFFYLVQEYIDGQTLEEELAQTGKFPETEIQKVLEQVLKILDFVHENGSIHRDIKPSNIIRHKNGRFYLLDFGAVKFVTKAVGQPQNSTGIYSAGFAPPEQMSGGQVLPCSDLYALAVTCLMFLTNKLPQELFDSYNNTWKWRNYAQVNSQLADVLDRMLLYAPADRYQSATEVLDALTPKPVVTPPPINPPPQKVKARPTMPQFSTIELLSSALFTGFESGIIAIALVSLLGTTLISAGFWFVLVGILIGAQLARFIEKVDFLILAVISLLVVGFVGQLNWASWFIQAGHPFLNILVIAGFTGLLALAIAILFRLIYKLISRLL